MPDDLSEEIKQLLEEHGPWLRARLERRIPARLRQRMDADDILQEVWFSVLKRYRLYRSNPQVSVRVWLIRRAKDCFVEAWRKQKRKCRDFRLDQPLSEESCPDDPWPDAASIQFELSGTTPSYAAIRAEDREGVIRTLQSLPARPKELIELRLFDGLDYKEMGEILGISAKAAQQAYRRALEEFGRLYPETGERDRS